MRSAKSATERRRFSLTVPDKVILAVLILLGVLILALGIVQRFGLLPINSALVLYLPMLAVAVLLGWGIYALVRRIGKPLVKGLVGGGLALLLMIVAILAFSYASYMSFYVAPQKYSTVTSPSGKHKLVVMRVFDTDEGRVEQRKAARLARAQQEGDPAADETDQEASLEDWGFIYKAYPSVLGLLYRSDADVEGEIYLSISDYLQAVEATRTQEEGSETAEAPAEEEAPHGRLMLEWLDEEQTAHFFVQDPGVAEGGECRVRF